MSEKQLANELCLFKNLSRFLVLRSFYENFIYLLNTVIWAEFNKMQRRIKL